MASTTQLGLSAALVVALIVVGCDADCPLWPTASTTSHGGPVRDHVSLVDNLRAAGFTVNIKVNPGTPALAGTSTLLGLTGGKLAAENTIVSTEFETCAQATSEAKRVSPAPKGETAGPTYFRKERVLVFCPSSVEASLLGSLEKLMGPRLGAR